MGLWRWGRFDAGHLEVSKAEAETLKTEDAFEYTTLLGDTHHVYAHSYLGYGQDHAYVKYLTI